ncbi:EAL domain-containing protein [Rhodoferax sp.]|uniref:EAL domain-containing protein n=1 Tax=Rhodoferax sp. TaxID=50421 RepID=UPI002728164A|nr:EAL domain-containing protein [Rhodoferax sp.]MDO9199563.1 EAL domain-containing protein [Rhodoferax sp.]
MEIKRPTATTLPTADESASAGQSLRQRSEEAIRETVTQLQQDQAAPSPAAMRQALHDLRVHQVELEMQNEELRSAQAELDVSRGLYFDLYDMAPVGYCTVSESGLILEANFTAATMLDVTRSALVHQPISRFILQQDQDAYYLCRKHLLASDEGQSCELRMVRRDGTHFWAQLVATAAQGEEGAPVLWLVLSDITARKHEEQTLRESEAFALAILDSVTAEIAVLDRNGVILAVNESWRRFARENAPEPGQPVPHTEIGVNYLAACRSGPGVPSDDALKAREGIQAVLDGSLSIFNLEYTCHSPREQRWFSMTATPLGPNRRGVVLAHTNITERKVAEETQREYTRQLQIASRMPGMVYQYRLRPDGTACFPFVSDAIRDIYRLSPEDVREDASKVAAMLHPADYDAFQASVQKSARDLTPWRHEYRVKLDDGTDRWLFGNSLPQREADGSVLWHGFITDITERHLAEEKLHLAASVFSHAREGIMITGADGMIIDVNEAFSRITGYSRDEAVGKNPRILNSGHHQKAFYAAMWADLTERGHWYGEVSNRRKSGEVYVAMETISAVRDTQGNTLQYVALFSDITAIKEHQNVLEHIAHFDALTGLPNRVLLADRLRQGMTQAVRRGQLLAVAFLDLDGFKAINDHHGHEAGDQLLIAVATRMKQALREGDSLARIGGDEFVAVLVDLADSAASLPMLVRLLAAAAQPVRVGDAVLQVSASLGVTFYPQAQEVEADQLLRQADQAMYQAKLAGKNRYHIFDAEQDRSVRGHHESLENVRHALARGEFVLHYQPRVNMRTGQVISAEALIRWQHPQRGLLLPAVFLPVIEDHALAVELGEWVIETALNQRQVWLAGGLDLPVSVNVGARQLQQADFVERLHQSLVAHPGVKPGDLELEVLETSALEDVAGVARVIEACREIGVLFALDDFGTGYSSLTYLKRLPVARLKIDQSFVRDMLDDPDDLAILEGVIGLASAFRRQVIAEGVETVEHGEVLLQLGCDLAQGYGIASPMPAHELPGWKVAWQPDPAWGNQPRANHDDVPMLFASAEHRAWIKAVGNYLRGERDVPPQMDHHQCQLGRWLEGDGLIRHCAHPSFAAIDTLHRQGHALAAELCELAARGRKAQALARLGELHALRDALLEHLKALVPKSNTAHAAFIHDIGL